MISSNDYYEKRSKLERLKGWKNVAALGAVLAAAAGFVILNAPDDPFSPPKLSQGDKQRYFLTALFANEASIAMDRGQTQIDLPPIDMESHEFKKAFAEWQARHPELDGMPETNILKLLLNNPNTYVGFAVLCTGLAWLATPKIKSLEKKLGIEPRGFFESPEPD